MRVIWGLLSAVLAIVFLAGLFTSLSGKRKSPYGTSNSVGSREVDTANEIEAARWGAVLAPPASRPARSPARRRGKPFSRTPRRYRKRSLKRRN